MVERRAGRKHLQVKVSLPEDLISRLREEANALFVGPDYFLCRVLEGLDWGPVIDAIRLEVTPRPVVYVYLPGDNPEDLQKVVASG